MSLGNSNLKQQRKSTTHQSTKNTTCCYYVEQQKLSFSTVENAKWFNHFKRQFYRFLQSWKMVTITLCTRQQTRHWCIEQSYGLSFLLHSACMTYLFHLFTFYPFVILYLKCFIISLFRSYCIVQSNNFCLLIMVFTSFSCSVVIVTYVVFKKFILTF